VSERPHIDALLEEQRTFPPPPASAASATVVDPAIYDRAAADPEGFWAEQADALQWSRRWDTVMEWTPPFVRWFVGGTLNASVNCLTESAGRDVAWSPAPFRTLRPAALERIEGMTPRTGTDNALI
jgi:hypothetical protein